MGPTTSAPRTQKSPPYAEHRATIAIDTLEILAGSLPDRALRLVHEWGKLHRFELEVNWRRARDSQPLEPIPPLP